MCHHSSIAGGCCNSLQDNSIYSFIGGGRQNVIQTTSTYGFIGGGCNNAISGAYSGILGGCNNNDAGCAFAGIFGCNITAAAPKTFHVNCLNACDTPIWVSGSPFPYGTIFTCCSGCGLPFGACPLFIQL
jgi:hypothetical protein